MSTAEHDIDWETALDEVDLAQVLAEVDGALLDNLAESLRFPTYESLLRASVQIAEEVYTLYRSDGVWVMWSPSRYKEEDPLFFYFQEPLLEHLHTHYELVEEGISFVSLLAELTQMKACMYCHMEFDPFDPLRIELGIERFLREEGDDSEYCSPKCAMTAIYEEMQD
ncbi:hypothetical protein [Mechercharimyces sp. CAU 1602]|uniref:hypothetical protein n=1 Tax=Mechercharimyces sp. CAU 1602 TaxID=2973933 RepID=UPI002161B365|nr:hypothetical protein [Mechercharimyces sp. CAU 1602]MCS1352326.1 hypothetical protein [Mechercharimyces sp. CAU 1602]